MGFLFTVGLFLFASLNHDTQGSITVTPRNSACEVGDTARLPCSSSLADSLLLWMEYKTITDVATQMTLNDAPSNAHPWKDSISIEGKYNLVLDAVKTNFSGLFQCRTLFNDGTGLKINDFRNAALIVIETTSCSAESQGGPTEGNIVVEDTPTVLTCKVTYSGMWAPVLSWYNSNGVMISSNTTEPGEALYQTDITPTPEMSGMLFRCVVSFRGPPGGVMPDVPESSLEAPEFESSCDVRLVVQYGPRFMEINPEDKKSIYNVGDRFHCSAESYPNSTYRWRDIHSSSSDNVIGDTLVVTAEMEGENEYRCTASALVGGVIKSASLSINFTVYVAPPTPAPTQNPGRSSNVGAVAGGIVAGLIALVFIGLVAFLVVKRNQLPREERTLSRTLKTAFQHPSNKNTGPEEGIPASPTGLENKGFMNVLGSGSGKDTSLGSAGSSLYYSDFPNSLKDMSKMKKKKKKKMRLEYRGKQVDPDNITLVKKLGEGSFGQVWQAQVVNLPGQTGPTKSAVKTLRANATDKDKSDLLDEMKVMEHLAPHKNVVSLYGYCTLSDPIMVIVEYMSEGDLQQYLRKHRSMQVYADDQGAEASVVNDKTLLLFAHQIAQGMTHISESGLLHRDLAARNILIGEGNICKVSDFGFARDVVDRNVYQRESQGPLPVRWMPPESLFDNIFTTKSDVWAFGVVMWEIVALGATPYPGLSSRQVMSAIKKGSLMEKPEHCVDAVYHVMTQCWRKSADERPSFADVTKIIARLLEEETDYLCLDAFNEDVYVNLPSNVTDEKV